MAADTDRIGRIVLFVLVAALAYAVVLMAQPFANALGWAAVIAIVFHPVHQRLEARYGAVRAASLSTAAVTVIVVVPVLLLTAVFVREIGRAHV